MAEVKAAYSLQQKKAVLNKASNRREQFFMSTFSSLSISYFFSFQEVLFYCNQANTFKKKKKKSLENMSLNFISCYLHLIAQGFCYRYCKNNSLFLGLHSHNSQSATKCIPFDVLCFKPGS